MANSKGNFKHPSLTGKLMVQFQWLESHLAPPVRLSLRFLKVGLPANAIHNS
jgi:hypothetical protein